jgi:hypothetical protein
MDPKKRGEDIALGDANGPVVFEVARCGFAQPAESNARI